MGNGSGLGGGREFTEITIETVGSLGFLQFVLAELGDPEKKENRIVDYSIHC